MEHDHARTKTDAHSITIRACAPADLDLVARFNVQLRLDEGHHGPSRLADLRARLDQFLADGWEIDLVLVADAIAGYALHRRMEYPAAEHEQAVFVRHYFIAPGWRRRGIGRLGFERLVDLKWRLANRIVVEVLDGNTDARAFWDSLDFGPYARTLERRQR